MDKAKELLCCRRQAGRHWFKLISMITDGENKLVKNYINDNNVKSAFDYFKELPNLAFMTIVCLFYRMISWV